MAKLKLSKSALQQERNQLKLYERTLPSLDLKRRQLTVELARARQALEDARSLAHDIGREYGCGAHLIRRGGAGQLVGRRGAELVEALALGGKLGGILWGRIIFSLVAIYILVRLRARFAGRKEMSDNVI